MGYLNDKTKELFVERLKINQVKTIGDLEKVVDGFYTFERRELLDTDDGIYLFESVSRFRKVIIGDEGDIIPSE